MGNSFPPAIAGRNWLSYPFHDKEILITACGRICLHRKKINLSTVFAGQAVGIKEVDDAVWLVSFMHCDLGYIDLEPQDPATPRQPLRPRVVIHVLGTFRYLCLRSVHSQIWRPQGDSNPRYRRERAMS